MPFHTRNAACQTMIISLRPKYIPANTRFLSSARKLLMKALWLCCFPKISTSEVVWVVIHLYENTGILVQKISQQLNRSEPSSAIVVEQ